MPHQAKLPLEVVELQVAQFFRLSRQFSRGQTPDGSLFHTFSTSSRLKLLEGQDWWQVMLGRAVVSSFCGYVGEQSKLSKLY